MKSRIMYIAICLATLLSGCSRSPRPANGVLIQTSGEFTPRNRAWKMTVQPDGQYQISEDTGDSTFDWNKFKFVHGSVGWSHVWNPKPGWFLYIENGDHLWEYDGAKELGVFVFTPREGVGIYSLEHYKGKVPDAVWQAIPAIPRAELQKLKQPNN